MLVILATGQPSGHHPVGHGNNGGTGAGGGSWAGGGAGGVGAEWSGINE